MTWITRHLHPRSLVLIDEFGKGTAPQGKKRNVIQQGWNNHLDGIALFLALLHHLHALENPHSYFLLTTHFSDYLKQGGCHICLLMVLRFASRSWKTHRNQANGGNSRPG